MLSVVHILRRKRISNFSIELIFSQIRDNLSNQLAFTVLEVPRFNDSFNDKFLNWIFILRNSFKFKNSLLHITGEIHYVSIFLFFNPIVLTIHDCGFVYRKKGIARYVNIWLYLKLPFLFTNKIIATSNEVKKDIIKWTGIREDAITVIPVPVRSDLVFVDKVFNSIKPRILHIGTAANKNLDNLLFALKGIDCELDIVGELTPLNLKNLKNLNIKYSNSVNLSNEEIKDRIVNCDILSFVSTFEGFGMPIIEANSVGRVVVTSSISSMPEVANDAACFVNPHDINSIRAGFIKVINDDTFRINLIEKGLLNKDRFSIESISNQYLNLYKELIQK